MLTVHPSITTRTIICVLPPLEIMCEDYLARSKVSESMNMGSRRLQINNTILNSYRKRWNFPSTRAKTKQDFMGTVPYSTAKGLTFKYIFSTKIIYVFMGKVSPVVFEIKFKQGIPCNYHVFLLARSKYCTFPKEYFTSAILKIVTVV